MEDGVIFRTVRTMQGMLIQEELVALMRFKVVGIFIEWGIRLFEVKEALRKMKVKKVLGPNGISIEVWKCMVDYGLSQLAKWFNKIIKTKKMLDEWRKTLGVPIYKNLGYSIFIDNHWTNKVTNKTLFCKCLWRFREEEENYGGKWWQKGMGFFFFFFYE